jgi:hypothetical protein
MVIGDAFERGKGPPSPAARGTSTPSCAFAVRISRSRVVRPCVLSKKKRSPGHPSPTIKFGVVRSIHVAHPASTNLAKHVVGTGLGACGDGHFFNPAVQLVTTVSGVTLVSDKSRLSRNLRPSAVTSYCWLKAEFGAIP